MGTCSIRQSCEIQSVRNRSCMLIQYEGIIHAVIDRGPWAIQAKGHTQLGDDALYRHTRISFKRIQTPHQHDAIGTLISLGVNSVMKRLHGAGSYYHDITIYCPFSKYTSLCSIQFITKRHLIFVSTYAREGWAGKLISPIAIATHFLSDSIYMTCSQWHGRACNIKCETCIFHSTTRLTHT